MTKSRRDLPEAETQLIRPEQLNQPTTIENVSAALVIAVANMLKIGRAVAKGPALTALREHCTEFLADTGDREK